MGFDDDPAKTIKFQALNLYGRSKLEFDRFAIGASEAPPLWFGLRYFNVYGFDESHKGAQASMAFHGRNQLLTAGAVRLFRGDLSQGGSFGDGEQKRDFVAVEDIVRLTFLLLSVAMNPEQRAAMLQRLAAAVPRGMNAPSLESGTVLNAGTGHARSWNDLARSVANGCKRPSAIEYIDMPQSLRAHYQSFTQAEHTVAKRLGLEFDWTRLEVGVQNYMDRLAAGAGAAAGGGGADAMDHKDRLALVKDPDPRAATKKDTKS
jgi:ADP-L-glycero-D-manno-heptose 6-epimerase